MTPTEREAYAIKLAWSTANRLARAPGSHIPPEDVAGAAVLGAMKALRQWDPARGVAFRTYAIAFIKGEIREECRRWDWLKRGPRTEAKEEHGASGEWPAWSLEPASLEVLVETHGDHIPDPDVDVEAEALARCESAEWRRLIAKLPRVCRLVFMERYLRGERPADICRAHGKTKSWADHMQKYGLPRLREWAEAAGLGR